MFYLVCGLALVFGIGGQIIPEEGIFIRVLIGLNMAGSISILIAFPAFKEMIKEAIAGAAAVIGIGVVVLSDPSPLETLLPLILILALGFILLKRSRKEQSAKV